MQRRPDIDGLRAVAVIPVLLYHAGAAPFSGGYVGVDIFFVISGLPDYIDHTRRPPEWPLLAPGVLRAADPADIPGPFYGPTFLSLRRSCALHACDFRRLGTSLAAVALFAANLLFSRQGGYFDVGADLKPLLHTWSLAIEEQYYIVFPLLMATMFAAKRGVLAVLVVLAAISFGWSIVELTSDPIGAFYSPVARAWELLLGAILAVRKQQPAASWLAELLAAVGAALILWSVLTYRADASFPGAKALAPCLGAALVIFSGMHHETMLARLLSARILVFIGLISYSLYLWHLPLLVFAKYYLMRGLSAPETALVLLCSVGLAVLSWRYVERPFRARGNYTNVRQRPLFVAATGVMVAAFSAGVLIYVSNGLPQRLPAEVSSLAMGALDTTFGNSFCNTIEPDDIAAGRACEIGTPAPGIAPSFALFGDSIGSSLLPAVESVAQEHGRKGVVLTRGGCYPLVGAIQTSDLAAHRAACKAFVDASVDYINAHPSITSVIVVGRWTSAAEGSRFGASMISDWYITDDQSPSAGYAENRRVFVRGIARTVMAFAGRSVSVVASLPEQKVDVPRTAALARYLGRDVRVDLDRKEFDERQQFVSAALAELSKMLDFVILDLGQSFCTANRCAATRGGRSLYSDDNHLSRDGALSTRHVFEPVFKLR